MITTSKLPLGRSSHELQRRHAVLGGFAREAPGLHVFFDDPAPRIATLDQERPSPLGRSGEK